MFGIENSGNNKSDHSSEMKNGKVEPQAVKQSGGLVEEIRSTKADIQELLVPSKAEQMEQFLDSFKDVRIQSFGKQAEFFYDELKEMDDESLSSLGDYSFVLVDDNLRNHYRFVPGLIAHAKSGAGIWWEGDRPLEELVQQLQALKPDFVLMDFEFDRGSTGSSIIQGIIGELPDVRFIGFSTGDGATVTQDFREAGAVGFVKKRPDGNYEIKETFLDLARFIEKLKD